MRSWVSFPVLGDGVQEERRVSPLRNKALSCLSHSRAEEGTIQSQQTRERDHPVTADQRKGPSNHCLLRPLSCSNREVDKPQGPPGPSPWEKFRREAGSIVRPSYQGASAYLVPTRDNSPLLTWMPRKETAPHCLCRPSDLPPLQRSLSSDHHANTGPAQ